MSTRANADYVARIVKDSGSSFAMAIRFMARDKRLAMQALYAYCRVLDDIADGKASVDSKEAALHFWRQEVNRLYAGQAQHPITQVMQALMPRYALPREELMLILDGVHFDAVESIHAPAWETLEYYGRCVAGAVGVAALPIFGDASPAAKEFAVTLGMALQLTNIRRDIAEDAAMGRLYMPAEMLADADVPAALPLPEILAHFRFAGACVLLADRAQQYFTEAEKLYQACNRQALLPAWLMLKTYQQVLQRLQRQGWQAAQPRLRLPVTVRTKLLMTYSLKLALPPRP